MKSKLAIVVILYGWVIFIAYILAEYREYGSGMFKHLFTLDSSLEDIFHRISMLIAPIGASILGYLINERKKLLKKTQSSEKETKLTQAKDAFFNMLKDLDVMYKEQKDIYNNLVIAFSNVIDAKSPWTKNHSWSVTAYAVTISREMGLREQDIEIIRTAGLLHDIGKIGTYDVILDKPDKLTDEEFALVKKHTIKGEEILKPIKGLESILPMIRSHHERIDGTGYPDGLKGEKIPFFAKILCVADAYDSMISERPYRPAPGKDYAISELKRCSGTQFDAEVVKAFLSVLERGEEIAD